MKRFFFNAVNCHWYSSCITFKIGPKVVKFLTRSINTSSIISILSLGLFNPSFSIIIFLVKTATNFDWCLCCLFMLCSSTENCSRKFVCTSHLLNVVATIWISQAHVCTFLLHKANSWVILTIHIFKAFCPLILSHWFLIYVTITIQRAFGST